MKRPGTLTPLFIIAAAAAVILLLVAPRANANRSTGIEAGDIAFVDVFELIDRALVMDEMTKARDDFSASSQTTLDALQQQLSTLETQLSTMQANDPNAGNIYSQYQNIQGQLQTKSQEIQNNYQTLIATQISSAYASIYSAANEIAADQGYAFVFATRSDGDLLQTDTITGITQEILARPLVTPPSSVNITEAVRVKLGYPEETAEIYEGASGGDEEAADASTEDPESSDPMDAQEPGNDSDTDEPAGDE